MGAEQWQLCACVLQRCRGHDSPLSRSAGEGLGVRAPTARIAEQNVSPLTQWLHRHGIFLTRNPGFRSCSKVLLCVLVLIALTIVYCGSYGILVVMASSEPTSSVSVAQSARWRRYARFVIPHVLTIAISLLLFSLLHRWFWAVPPPVTPLIATVTPVPTIPPTPIPTPQPTPPSPPPSEGLLRLTILDLQAENAQLRTITHLLRAAITLDEALNALQRNDFAEADRALMMARRALDRAYNLSTEPQKGPIDAIRLQISQIRDDLGVRPEGADRRLWQVRRLILALVDE